MWHFFMRTPTATPHTAQTPLDTAPSRLLLFAHHHISHHILICTIGSERALQGCWHA